jgi:hypothetical protein
MPAARQLSFPPSLTRARRKHGGEIRKGKRKEARPFHPKLAVHLIRKSSRARGSWSMLHPSHKGRVYWLVESKAEKHGIRVHQSANVGNHLHLLIRARSHASFKRFLRELSGAIAQTITGATKANPQKFWDGLAFSRLVTWGRDFAGVQAYIIRNLLEGVGAIDRHGKDSDLQIQAVLRAARAGPP